MRLQSISIENYRSIVTLKGVRIEAIQAFVGENNAGKSNILRAIDCFLSSGAGGVRVDDFGDPQKAVIIECEFGGLSPWERRRLRPYLIGDRIVLRKELTIISATTRGRESTKVEAQYHGYQAEPKDPNFSIAKCEDSSGKPNWEDIANRTGVRKHIAPSTKVTKTVFKAALEQYLANNDVEYDDPVLGNSQALGIPQNLLAVLPEYFLLPAITDYSDEINRQSTTTVFRRLMAELGDRLMRKDPRYKHVEAALANINALLNGSPNGEAPERLGAFKTAEEELRQMMQQLMPSTRSVALAVEVEEPKKLFARGVTVKIDDGALTEVLDKGHGMQRSMVFAMLQMLIKLSRAADGNNGEQRAIMLGIEEPELYIHPHAQRLIFNVLKDFAGVDGKDGEDGSNQVIYTTHSPAFIEVSNYERIAVVRKLDPTTGTTVRQAAAGVLGDPEEKRIFKLLTSFGLKHNEVFFARDVVLVEGPQDEVAVIATGRKLGRFRELPEEVGVSITYTGGKGEVPKFQKVLNAFGLSYGVLLEMDGNSLDDKQNKPILDALNGNRIASVPQKMEDFIGLGKGHFDDTRNATIFFSDPNNISDQLEKLVADLLPPAASAAPAI